MPYALPAGQLPLELPAVKAYKPTATGQPPLGNAVNWQTQAGQDLAGTSSAIWTHTMLRVL